jgi:hypothetical protein
MKKRKRRRIRMSTYHLRSSKSSLLPLSNKKMNLLVVLITLELLKLWIPTKLLKAIQCPTRPLFRNKL